MTVKSEESLTELYDLEAVRAKYRKERDKRMTVGRGSDVSLPPTAALDEAKTLEAKFAHFTEDPFAEPGFTRQALTDEVEVAIIGGGFGGLMTGARLREAGFTEVGDIRIIEKAGDFGGTWYWNRYPGAMCDIESYCYLPLLEELQYVPKHKYSYAPEIFEHSRAIGRHYNLYANACFQTVVTDIRWDEPSATWIISTDRGDRMKARFVVMATGPQSVPKVPAIPGLSTFEGHMFHTSRWDYGYTGGDTNGNHALTGLSDKRVGVIGTGASAIQCVPPLGEWAKHLYVFQRTPSVVAPRNNRETDPAWARALEPGWQQQRLENFNALTTGEPAEVDLVDDGWTAFVRQLMSLAGKAVQESARPLTEAELDELVEVADFLTMEELRSRVEGIVRDGRTAEALKPYFRLFCKRPCFHDEYLDTFNRPNVTLVDTAGKGVERVTPRGVIADGREYEVDCLVFATGFDVVTSFMHRAGFDIVGGDGLRLSEHWADGMRTFHGFFTHGFPNYLFVGRTQAAQTFNYPHLLNEQTKHVAHILSEARRRSARTLEATTEAEQHWVDVVRSSDVPGFGEKFFAECTPGYYNSEGKTGNPEGFFRDVYGAGATTFFKLLRDWRAAGRFDGLVVTTYAEELAS